MHRSLTPPAAVPTSVFRATPAQTIGFTLACLLALNGQMIASVWQTGAFGDSDDAMRMVQVRDWMAGQSWFDLHAHRLGLPGGREMHWSRVIDVPIAALVRLFGLVAAPEPAERLARIVFPLLLQISLLLILVRTAVALAGERAAAPACVILLASGFMFSQFMPGRIDHHAPQIVLLSAICLAAVRALAPGEGFRFGLACGGAMCLSLAISIENLPMIAAAGAFFAALWGLEGDARRPALAGLALALLAGLPILFVATVPPGSWLEPSCDAYSGVHLTLGAAAAVGCLAALPATGARPAIRWLALGALATGLAVLTLGAFPECARDPYSAVDPVVRRLWLNQVQEARPLSQALKETAELMRVLLPAGLIGLVGGLLATTRETGAARRRWAAVALLTATAFATTWWKVAAVSGFLALAGLGFVWLLLQLQTALQRHGEIAARVAAILLALFISPMGLSGLLPATSGAADRAAATPSTCLAPDAYRALDALPPGLVFAPIDMGAHLLAHTRHSVVAAPYHRNGVGNRLVLEALEGEAAAARGLVLASGADYLAACAQPGDMSLTGRLARGDAPDWLTPLADAGAIQLYRIAR